MITGVKEAVNGSVSKNILIIQNKVHLLPHITQKTIHMSLTKVIGAIKPVRAENPNVQLSTSTSRGIRRRGGIFGESVEKRSAVIPLKVIQNIRIKLLLNDVQVTAVGPVVPKIYYLKLAAVIHH